MADNVTLCGPVHIDRPVSFLAHSGCCREFLTRCGLLDATIGPLPSIEPEHWLVHSSPLSAPMPWPELQVHLLGDPSPDRGQTRPWP